MLSVGRSYIKLYLQVRDYGTHSYQVLSLDIQVYPGLYLGWHCKPWLISLPADSTSGLGLAQWLGKKVFRVSLPSLNSFGLQLLRATLLIATTLAMNMRAFSRITSRFRRGITKWQRIFKIFKERTKCYRYCSLSVRIRRCAWTLTACRDANEVDRTRAVIFPAG